MPPAASPKLANGSRGKPHMLASGTPPPPPRVVGFLNSSAAGDTSGLASLYSAKCGAIGLATNSEIHSRLTLLDSSTHSHLFDFSDLPVDITFEILLEVLLLAASISAIDASNTSLTDKHVDTLVHHLSRSVGIKTLYLNDNPGITDKGGLYLLDLAQHTTKLIELEIQGTSIRSKLRDQIAAAIDSNIAAQDDDLSVISHDGSRHDSRDRSWALAPTTGGDRDLERTNRQAAQSFSRLHGSPSVRTATHTQQSYLLNRSRSATGQAAADGADPVLNLACRTLLVSQYSAVVCCGLLNVLETIFSILAWEKPFRSGCILAAGLSTFFFDPTGPGTWWLLLLLTPFLQQRLWRKNNTTILDIKSSPTGSSKPTTTTSITTVTSNLYLMKDAHSSTLLRWLNGVRHSHSLLSTLVTSSSNGSGGGGHHHHHHHQQQVMISSRYLVSQEHQLETVTSFIESADGKIDQHHAEALELLESFVHYCGDLLDYYGAGGLGRRRLLIGLLTVFAILNVVSLHTLLGIGFVGLMMWRPILERMQNAMPKFRKKLIQLLGGSTSLLGSPSSPNAMVSLNSSSSSSPLVEEGGGATRHKGRKGHGSLRLTESDVAHHVAAKHKRKLLRRKQLQSAAGGGGGGSVGTDERFLTVKGNEGAGGGGGGSGTDSDSLSSPTVSSLLGGRAHQEGEDAFASPFPFLVRLDRLIDVDAQHLSGRGFIPLVQIKYNRTSWVSKKVRSPYEWKADSNVFCFIPGITKLTIVLFDDATEMVGAVTEGTLILDDSVLLDEPIAVPLHAVEHESTFLRSMLDDVLHHERKTRKITSGSGGTGLRPNADFLVERPGAVVIRLSRVDGGEQKQRNGGTSCVDVPPPAVGQPAPPAPQLQPPPAARFNRMGQQQQKPHPQKQPAYGNAGSPPVSGRRGNPLDAGGWVMPPEGQQQQQGSSLPRSSPPANGTSRGASAGSGYSPPQPSAETGPSSGGGGGGGGHVAIHVEPATPGQMNSGPSTGPVIIPPLALDGKQSSSTSAHRPSPSPAVAVSPSPPYAAHPSTSASPTPRIAGGGGAAAGGGMAVESIVRDSSTMSSTLTARTDLSSARSFPVPPEGGALTFSASGGGKVNKRRLSSLQ